MQIEIFPSKAQGSIQAPPSKSMAHRLLICAGLADGKSHISGVAPSQDVLATIDCLRAIGADCQYDGDTVEVKGVDARHTTEKGTLSCRECGSTLRFFIPIALLSGNEVTLTGSQRLLERPLGVYEQICRERNMKFEHNGSSISVCGPLTSGRYELAGNVSSQFISGLLFALPLLEGESEICITNKLESRAYIDLTLSALADFGVCAFWKNGNVISVQPSQRYHPRNATVEGDYSNAAFFEALNLSGGNVTVTGLREGSLQGDRVYAPYFRAINAGSPTLDISECPDLGPVLIAVAAAKHGAVLTGTARLKIKESDRGTAMARELAKMGAKIEVGENEIVIPPTALHAPEEMLDGHNDHRIVMALSVLLTKYGGRIGGAEAVSKSMPDFFEALTRLGVKTKQYDIG